MRYIIIFFVIIFLPLTIYSSTAEDYYVELGKTYYERGQVTKAEVEFSKAVQINPNNHEANHFLDNIRQARMRQTLDDFPQSALNRREQTPYPIDTSKDYVPYEPYEDYSMQPQALEPEGDEDKEEDKEGKFKISGQYQLSLGYEGGDFLWKRANFDLNEENWRLLSSMAYNRRENTFDPAIYSQLKVNLDYEQEYGFGFHTLLDISPWSFIGKSDRITIPGLGGDSAEIQLKYWSNTRHTINEAYHTLQNGDSILVPEIRVVNGQIASTLLMSSFGNAFILPELEIHREFWPLREMWVDYKQPNYNIRVFPMALQDQAYTSNDPLMLTNHHIWWKASEWLVNWQPGNFNSGTMTQDFFKGEWNDALANFTRDSSGTLLTGLRGFSINAFSDRGLLDFTMASPKELWQDYDSFNTINSALRGRYSWLDNLTVGFVYGSKFGYNERALDAFNHVFGLDANFGIGDNSEIFFEAATSRSDYDRTSTFETEKDGNAFHISFINSSSEEVFGKDYFGVVPVQDEAFYKWRIAYTHMDKGFESALSDYRNSRNDTFWSRHLTFRKPFEYHYEGLYGPSLGWDDIKIWRIGDGIDYGRDVGSMRFEVENLFDNKLDALFDVRNVHDTTGAFIENVARLETTFRATDKLTAKFLGLYQHMPKTTAGVDPFMYDPDTGLPLLDWSTNPVQGGQDPSLKTVSLGAEYWFLDWLGADAIWEHTNDYTLAYDNFPRGILNASMPVRIFYEDGMAFRADQPFLYGQGNFPQPPYPWYDIFKAGIKLRHDDKLNVYLNYTHNDFDWAQIIDDNMNHVGLELEYFPWKKLSFYFRYVYSKVNDISELVEEMRLVQRRHHNFFSEARLHIEENSEFVLQYGVGNNAAVGTINYTPFGGGVATLDTQHIVRAYYRKKF